jgi:deoxyribonuclease-4
VIDQHHRVGCNIPLQKTLLSTLEQGSARGSHCVQFFMGGNQNYRVRQFSQSDLKASQEYCDKWGKTFYVHCPLIANLSRDPGSKDEKSLTMLRRSWASVESEVRQMNGLPASCILHMGTKGTIEHLVKNLNDFPVPRNRSITGKKLLCLENSAGSGSQLGRDFTEIRKTFEGLDHNKIGFCLDTQHVYGGGTNQLSTHEDVVKLFDDIEESYGGKPDVIHLNDSVKTFGSRVDRHGDIGKGYIWSNNSEGLRSLLDWCYSDSIDCILETPNMLSDLQTIRTKYMDLETIDRFIENDLEK